MRIHYLAFIRLPTEKAHGLQVMKTCEALADLGAEVELVVPGRGTHITEDPFSYYGAKKNFTITPLNTPDFVQFGFLGFMFSLLWFSEAAKWRKSFWDADIVYSRDALVLFQYVLLGRPLVHEVHQKPSWISRFVAKRAHRLIVISRALAESYERAGVSKERIVVAPDAVDAKRFESVPSREAARRELSLSNDGKIVLYAGHLYARKGADTVAEAARELSDVFFVFIGGTIADVQTFKAKWKGKNVIIQGHVAPKVVPTYLAAADILIVPNSGKDEDSRRFGSPMKVFEYMASGTPIIASDVPALREILSDDTALFVPPDDPKLLAEGIQTALKGGMHGKAEAAQERVRSFSWNARANRILDSFT